jgi:hypothetical protein
MITLAVPLAPRVVRHRAIISPRRVASLRISVRPGCGTSSITPAVQGIHIPGPGGVRARDRARALAPNEILNGAPGHLAMSLAPALAVTVVWLLLALGSSAWRTITRDA